MTKTKAKTERHCPSCGELHGSSFIPPDELEIYVEDAGELKELRESGAGEFRVFRCDDAFHVVPHTEEG